MEKQDLVHFLKKYNVLRIIRNKTKNEIEKLEREIEKCNVMPLKIDTSRSATCKKYLTGYIAWLILLTIVFAVIIFIVTFIMLIIGNGALPDNFFTKILKPISLWAEKHVFLCEYAIFNLPITSIILAFPISAVLSIPCGIPDRKGEKRKYEERLCLYYEQQKKMPELVQQKDFLIKKLRDIDANLSKMKNQGIVHQKYEYYIPQLIEFLETGRADTVKEAVNLLEYQWDIEARQKLEREISEERRKEAKEQAEILAHIEGNSEQSAAATDALLQQEWLDKFF